MWYGAPKNTVEGHHVGKVFEEKYYSYSRGSTKYSIHPDVNSSHRPTPTIGLAIRPLLSPLPSLTTPILIRPPPRPPITNTAQPKKNLIQWNATHRDKGFMFYLQGEVYPTTKTSQQKIIVYHGMMTSQNLLTPTIFWIPIHYSKSRNGYTIY